ncbi:hypothetical protein ABKV19_020517, partial [Rosa sericea]
MSRDLVAAQVIKQSAFTDKQIVKLQETPDEIPEGGAPHTVSLLMHDKLVDAGKPGDRVEVTGIYRALSIRVGPTQRTVKSLFKTYIDCLHIKKFDKAIMLAEEQTEVENSLGGIPRFSPSCVCLILLCDLYGTLTITQAVIFCNTKKNNTCLSAFQAPLDPSTTLGGFSGNYYYE